MLTATDVGKLLNLSPRAVNMHLANIGMITHTSDGWVLTAYGKNNGGIQNSHPQTGSLFVTWSEVVLQNPCVKNLAGHANTPEPMCKKEQRFRTFYPAKLRAIDGHYVRTRAELLIDNWLYGTKVVHAYEMKVPIEQEMYADFYLPDGRLYVEYMGSKDDSQFAEHKKAKLDVYDRYKLRVIEIHDDSFENLEDEFSQTLMASGIVTHFPFPYMHEV